MTPGLIVFAHGSRIESANEGVRAVARDLAKLGSFPYVQPAFLELGQPDLAGAVATLASQGAETIVVLPYFLTLGLHLERDLPKLIAEVQQAHHGVRMERKFHFVAVGPRIGRRENRADDSANRCPRAG